MKGKKLDSMTWKLQN